MAGETRTAVTLDQATLRVLYDALREAFALTQGHALSDSPSYDAGVRKGIDMSIDLLVRLNDGCAPALPPIGGAK